MAGASEWFGGRPKGFVGLQRGIGFRAKFYRGEGKSFSFRKYGEEHARSAAEKWRDERSLALGKTKNLVRKHPEFKGCLIMKLTAGRETLIDEDDYDNLSNFTWYTSNQHLGIVYADARDGDKKISMHRYLCNPGPGKETDHLDGDGLNNRRANLRSVTSKQNNNNRRLSSRNTSGENGISWNRKDEGWLLRWREDGKAVSKCFFVRPRGSETLKGIQKRNAVAHRDMVYRRIGNSNGLRPKK